MWDAWLVRQIGFALSEYYPYGIISLLNYRDVEEIVNAKKDISTKNKAPCESTRFQTAHVNCGWAQRFKAQTLERPHSPDREAK